MANRVKTVEYAFPLSSANVNSATARDFTSITIYIPETGITFNSVILEMGSHTFGGTGSVTAVLMGISLGAIARDDATVTQTIANSGENYSFIFTRNVTSYFSTNWTGSNMSSGARLTVTGPTTASAFAKLMITYSYDNVGQTTRLKTVRIPMDGNTGGLTTSLANVGGVSNQIPNLSTFLPENSKVIRDIFFETYCHTGMVSGTNDTALNLRFDGTNTLSTTYEGGGTTDYSIKRIDKSLTLFNTGATSNFEASTGNAVMPFTCLTGILFVTYEYNESSSTTILNSIVINNIDGQGWLMGDTVPDTYNVVFYANEPGTLTLVQSGVLVTANDSGALDINVSAGAQGQRIYSHPASVRSGNVFMGRRVDSGAAGGSSEWVVGSGYFGGAVFVYSTGTTLGTYGTNVSGSAFINYTSGKSSYGSDAHSHTTYWIVHPYSVDQGVRETNTPDSVPAVGDDNGALISNVSYVCYLITSGTLINNIPISMKYYTSFGEYKTFYDTMYVSDDEIGTSILYIDATRLFDIGIDNGTGANLVVSSSMDITFSFFPEVCYLSLYQVVTSSNIITPIIGEVGGTAGLGCTLVVYDFSTGYVLTVIPLLANVLSFTGATLLNTTDIQVRGQLSTNTAWVYTKPTPLSGTVFVDFSVGEYGFGGA